MQWQPDWTPNGPLDVIIKYGIEVQRVLLSAAPLLNNDHFKAVLMYETALKMDPNCAYAWLRLADVESRLQDQMNAAEHYRKAQECIGGPGKDAVFDKWLMEWEKWYSTDMSEDHHSWTEMQASAAIIWRPIECLDNYSTPESISSLESAKQGWDRLIARDGEGPTYERAWRLYNIETCQIENVFKLQGDTIPRLVRVGTYQAAIDRVSFDQGLQSDKSKIVKILQDCKQSLDVLLLVLRDRSLLTKQFILNLHKVAIYSSRFQVDPFEPIQYVVPIGKFRNSTSDTTLLSPVDGKELVVYCHPDKIEEEMDKFLNFIMALPIPSTPMDAVRQAAWIHTAFVIIHPFADGNGRIARLLGSIPLLTAHLPPMVFRDTRRENYIEACAAASGSHNLGPLIYELVHGHQDLVNFLEQLAPLTSDDKRYTFNPQAGVTRYSFLTRTAKQIREKIDQSEHHT